MSSGLRTCSCRISIRKAAAAASTGCTKCSPGPAAASGLSRIAARVRCGAISLSRSSHFAATDGSKWLVKPVTLPPGRARLSTSPLPTGFETRAKTIGTVRDRRCKAAVITAALHRRSRTVPIVFALVSNPVGSGLVESLARPGGNVTGFTNHFEPSVAAKWLDLLKEIAPHLTRAAILLNPDAAAGPGEHFVQPVEAAAAALRMEIRQLQVRRPEDIEPAVTGWAR